MAGMRFPSHRHTHHAWGPVGRFVRARLRRRIFLWFASGILATALFSSAFFMILGRTSESAWQRLATGAVSWAGSQFARDWEDPAAREAFAKRTAEQLGVSLQLVSDQGDSLVSTGDSCGRHALEIPVGRGAERLGTVLVCPTHSVNQGWRFILGFGIAVAVLWLVSGRVARRLARPLDELTEVVRRIGAGDLTARAVISCREPDELGIVAEAVNEMAGRIQKQLADQRELLATVSHELRTPLARMRIISEIARDGGATTKTYDDLDREVEEMDALVGELLASSRVEFGVVTSRELSVRDVVGRALERAGLPSSVLQLEGAGDRLTADPTLLQRALANLFANAVTHAGGVASVRVQVGSERVSFEVLDNGPGLPDGGEGALFQKFQKNGGSEGLGLGLTLVKRIAEAHGGTVWARQREGAGSVFGFDVRVGAPDAGASSSVRTL